MIRLPGLCGGGWPEDCDASVGLVLATTSIAIVDFAVANGWCVL